MDTSKMIADIEKHKKRIGEERDKLRELLDEIESICSDCEEAELGLEDAVDALGRNL